MLRVNGIVWALVVTAAVLVSASAGLAAAPRILHVIDASAMSEGESVMVQSLQGVLAKTAGVDVPAIWISGDIDPALLTYLQTQFQILLINEPDALTLLSFLSPQVTGYEECDLGLRSMNVAAPLAGVDGALVASTPEMVATLSSGLFNLTLKNDVSQFDETYWLGSNFADLNQGLVIEQGLQPSALRTHLRDLSASEKAFTFTNDVLDGSTLRQEAMDRTTDHSYLLGFPQDQNQVTWIRASSAAAHPAVRAETCNNLSVLSRIGTGQTYNQPASSHMAGQVTTTDGVHYVCMVMDGGWDIGWTLNQFSKPNWFGHSRRGTFPMNWEISPALLDWAPPALASFYSQSSQSDFFVSSPSGYGMLYPRAYPDLVGYAKLLGPKVRQTDLRVVNVMGDVGGTLSDARPIVDRPEVIAVFYKTNNARGEYYTGIAAGTYDVHSGKVIWPYRYALWNNGLEASTADGIASSILNDTHRSPTSDPLSYSLIAVYPFAFWDGDPEGSSIMDEVANLVDQLQTDPGIRIVSAEEFAWRLRENFGDGQTGPEFPDVPTTYWAWENIEAVARNGIAQGFPDGTYVPGLTVDRAQMAVFIARAIAGGDANVPSGPAVASFDDVPKTHFAYRYVEFCKLENVVQGFTPTTYGPDVPVNRGQMAVFIARAKVAPDGDAGLPPAPFTARFPDVPTSFWAFRWIEYVADPARGIVFGYPDGLYHPEVEVARDQMAVFIARAFGLM